MFFFVLLINMMRSRVPNHIQAVPESASERDMRIRTVANPAGSVVPEPHASTLPAGRGGTGGRTDGQSSRLAGSRLPALCAPGRLPVPFIASTCWEAAASPSGPHPGWSPIPLGQAPPQPPGRGPPAHRLRWPLMEPGRPRHCRPRWMGLPRVRGQASWLPAPAPRGCAGPGCGGAGLHTAGPCPWNWPGRGGEKRWVVRPLSWAGCHRIPRLCPGRTNSGRADGSPCCPGARPPQGLAQLAAALCWCSCCGAALVVLPPICPDLLLLHTGWPAGHPTGPLDHRAPHRGAALSAALWCTDWVRPGTSLLWGCRRARPLSRAPSGSSFPQEVSSIPPRPQGYSLRSGKPSRPGPRCPWL